MAFTAAQTGATTFAAGWYSSRLDQRALTESVSASAYRTLRPEVKRDATERHRDNTREDRHCDDSPASTMALVATSVRLTTRKSRNARIESRPRVRSNWRSLSVKGCHANADQLVGRMVRSERSKEDLDSIRIRGWQVCAERVGDGPAAVEKL